MKRSVLAMSLCTSPLGQVHPVAQHAEASIQILDVLIPSYTSLGSCLTLLSLFPHLKMKFPS